MLTTPLFMLLHAERIADKWRETYKDDQSFRVVVVGPNSVISKKQTTKKGGVDNFLLESAGQLLLEVV